MATKEQYEAQERAVRSLQEAEEGYQEFVVKESEELKKFLKIQKQVELARKTGKGDLEELTIALELQRLQLKKNDEAYLEHKKNLEDQKEKLEELRKEIEESEKAYGKYKKAIDETTKVLDKFTGANVSSLTTVDGFLGAVMDLTFALNNMTVQLTRTTGYTKDFQDNLTRLVRQNGKFAITLKESAEIIGGLSTGMARFNMLGDDQQDVLQNIASRFKRLGVDINQLAPAIDKINFAFGMTGEAAAAATRSLEDMADEVGRPLAAVVQDLNEVAPTLSRFGQRGLEVFRKLNIQARELGLTVKQAFDTTELFDTFESAANVAGRLNAQLGLQLNSVELLKASSEDRIDILRQEFQLQGQNFESMGRRQRQMIASILNTDEETAARLLGDRLDITKFQKQAAKEKTIGDMVSMQERMTALMQDLLMDLATIMNLVFQAIVTNYETLRFWFPKLIFAVAAAKLGGSLLKNKNLLGKVPGAGGTMVAGGSATALTGAAAAKAGAKSVLRTAPIVGSILAGGFDAYNEYSMTGSKGRAAGVAAGSVGGTLAGAAAGAAIGSVVPLIGTALGGLIGGLAGSFGGTALARGIMGEAKPPEQRQAEMNQRFRQSRENFRRSMSSGDQNISVGPVSVELDGKVLGKFTLNTVNGAVNPVTATSITY